MSERDDRLSVVGSLIGLLIVIVMALAAWRIGNIYDEIRDLQRRVGQLESERR